MIDQYQRRYIVLSFKPDGTIKGIGPFTEFLTAKAYHDFIRDLNAEADVAISEIQYTHNRWGAPANYAGMDYNFINESEVHSD